MIGSWREVESPAWPFRLFGSLEPQICGDGAIANASVTNRPGMRILALSRGGLAFPTYSWRMCRATIGVRGIGGERVCANGSTIEVARVRITEAGRRALAKQ